MEDSVRVFEVLSSHYLELNSDKGLVETDKVIAKKFELDGMLPVHYLLHIKNVLQVKMVVECVFLHDHSNYVITHF